MNQKKIIYNIDGLTANEKIRIMDNFTQSYKKYSSEHIAIREAMCLKEQYPATMCDIEECDLLAGRVIYLPLGFSPEPGGLGYYFQKYSCEELLSSNEVSCENKEKLKEIIEFWEKENTQAFA